jgi:hypothetical protein
VSPALPPVVVEPIRQPLSKIIHVTSTESIDPVPLSYNPPRSILKTARGTSSPVKVERLGTDENRDSLRTENDKLAVNLSTLVEENRRLQGNLARLTKEKETAETSMREVITFLNVKDLGSVISRLTQLTSDLAYSEGRQVALSEEKKSLEVELEKERQEIRRLAQELKTQETFKNREIERLTDKGHSLQERIERLFASIRTKKVAEEVFDQVTAIELPSEIVEENAKLQAEIDGLKSKLIENEHDYFVRENDLLQKIAALDLHLERMKEEVGAATKQAQMANVRSSLERLPRENRGEAISESETKNTVEVERIKAVLFTTSGDLEKSRNEVYSLTTTLRLRSEELEEQEVKLFEACLRVAFLSSELERLRSTLYAKS